MRERNIIEIPKASASDNTTAFSSPELNSIGYFTQAGKKYEYVKWGANDQLPYEMIDKVERNSVLSQNKLFNLLTCYSRGIEYMDIPAEGEEPCEDIGDVALDVRDIQRVAVRLVVGAVVRVNYDENPLAA